MQYNTKNHVLYTSWSRSFRRWSDELRDQPWCRHQMETFSALLALHEGNRPAAGGIPRGQWPGALMFSLICAWTRGWANTRDAGDLRRHHGHYVVTVITLITLHIIQNSYIHSKPCQGDLIWAVISNIQQQSSQFPPHFYIRPQKAMTVLWQILMTRVFIISNPQCINVVSVVFR